ncbi:PucR family transcriptional regulator [Neobacillus niacini]|uniref:PucR family transcriptional regulator n=1 Tax=Neobacillus niacini TaxID=86668 RepID=UPI0039834674
MITIQDILRASAFDHSEVVAGKKGLSREVKMITVAEVPDAANWLRGGELVCTTAFFIGNKVEHEKEWIESLIKNGAAALAIKTSRFLGVMPKEMINVANHYDFPIISLPHEITWPIVIESFMDFFMNERMKIMQLVEDVQNSLINLVLENRSIQTIVNKIANLAGNPIILEDARLQTIAIGNIDSEETNTCKAVIDHRVSSLFKNKVLQSPFYKDIQKGGKNEKIEMTVRLEDEPQILNIMIPIFSNQSLYGFISLLECHKPHTPMDLIILENSTTALALQLMQQYLYEQTSNKKTIALIEDIIHGRIHTQIVFEYDFLNINWSNPMAAILIEFMESKKENNNNIWDRSEEMIAGIIKNGLNKHFGQVIIGNNGSLYSVLVSFSPKQIKKVTPLLREEIGKALAELENHYGKGKFRVGIGGVYDKLDKVGRSYKEANSALTILKKFERKGSVLFFEDVGIHRILSMVSDSEEIRDFCYDFLSELIRHDQENGNVLLDTFHTFLLCDCSIKETADKLFLHPNTVAYRIKKVKQIIKHDLTSPEFKLAYLFAMESYQILKN